MSEDIFVKLVEHGLLSALGSQNVLESMEILEIAFDVDQSYFPPDKKKALLAMEFINFMAESYVIKKNDRRIAEGNRPMLAVGKVRSDGNSKPPKPKWLHFDSDGDTI